METSKYKNNADDSRQNQLFTAWKLIRPVMIFLTSLLIVIGSVYLATDYFLQHYWLPADRNDTTPVQVIIPKGSSVGEIADILFANGLIKSANVFEYYIDFSGYGSKMLAGTYSFTKQMSMKEIMDKLAKGAGTATVTTFMVIEGSTIEQAANKLKQDGIISDTARFLDLCKTGQEFMSYSFIAELDYDEDAPQRTYMMEGYLFPDKYEIYVGSSEETIIKKMLNKFGDILTEKMIARANELDMTVDDIITLASIIEEEAKPNDFAKVSAVFFNRLGKDMKLESCATVQYALGYKKLNLSNEELSFDSPYNTYKHSGLPVGPICSPSQKAIEAALYPDPQFLQDGYLYFVTKDPISGELEFNKTYAEHEAAKAKYKPLWEEYDRTHNN